VPSLLRALETAPEGVPTPLHRRFVQRAQVCALLPDHVVAGEPYLSLNGLALPSNDAAELAHLSEVFCGVFDRIAQRLCRDVPGLVDLGFPWMAAELLAAETPRVPLVGRFDFVRDRQGRWWLLEFNADTPSGIRESTVLDALLARFLPSVHRLGRPNAQLGPTLQAAFSRAVTGLSPGQHLGLVTTAAELEDLAQMAFTQRLLRVPLARQGLRVVLGDVDNLGSTRAGVTLCGVRVGALYRYVALEAMLGTRAWSAVFSAVAAGTLRLLNGLYGLLLQHKALMAHVWDHRHDEELSPMERQAIQEHLPPTWLIGDLPSGEHRAGLVVKQFFGREGEEVYFGDALSQRAWNVLAAQRTHICQRRIDVEPLDAVVPGWDAMRLQRGFVTVGSFVVDGRWAGFYTRFGGPIITSRAKWMATYTE
jgi:glutathionylspermidine synthase